MEQYLYKVNETELEGDKPEMSAREIIALAAEKGIIDKDGEYVLYDEKSTPIDADAIIPANTTASFWASKPTPADMAS